MTREEQFLNAIGLFFVANVTSNWDSIDPIVPTAIATTKVEDEEWSGEIKVKLDFIHRQWQIECDVEGDVFPEGEIALNNLFEEWWPTK